MKKIKPVLLFATAALLVTAGCQGDAKKVTKQDLSAEASSFVLTEEPEGGLDVAAARKTVAHGDEIVVVGRIGGSTRPWVEGTAAFDIVDSSLLACSDEKPEGESCSCPTPWDYCCESDKLPDAMVSVRFVDPEGSVVKHDARELFGLKELQTVVVRGTARRVEGNLTILANGIYVRD